MGTSFNIVHTCSGTPMHGSMYLACNYFYNLTAINNISILHISLFFVSFACKCIEKYYSLSLLLSLFSFRCVTLIVVVLFFNIIIPLEILKKLKKKKKLLN